MPLCSEPDIFIVQIFVPPPVQSLSAREFGFSGTFRAGRVEETGPIQVFFPGSYELYNS
jgi:hypothetical protein